MIELRVYPSRGDIQDQAVLQVEKEAYGQTNKIQKPSLCVWILHSKLSKCRKTYKTNQCLL